MRDAAASVGGMAWRVAYKTLIVMGMIVLLGAYGSPYVPRHTLTNGDVTVVFQGMRHVADRSFYEDVREAVREARKDGFVVFFEGVDMSDSGEEVAGAKDAVSGIIETYSAVADIQGLARQDDAYILLPLGPRDRNVDVGIKDIAEKARELGVEAEL